MTQVTDPGPSSSNGPIHFVILTGTSGAGKSHALNYLEDLGFFCVDNLPLALVPQFVNLCKQSTPAMTRVALVMDVRERTSLADSAALLRGLKKAGHRVETLFFDADDTVLIRRFSETRRPHPLSPDGSVPEGLALERTALTPLRDSADRRIDTSSYSVHDLKAYIHRHFGAADDDKGLTISVVAFGFKYGIPLEADLLFDVRFLDNPHFVPDLKPKTGEDSAVRDYVLADQRSEPLLECIYALLDLTIPEYDREGRRYLTIGIGCTGGKHRSVVISRELAKRLSDAGHQVTVRLRDAHGAAG
jgi:UPF0042 nucleotide-binding protein